MKFLSLFFSEQMGVSECVQHNVISTSEQGSEVYNDRLQRERQRGISKVSSTFPMHTFT